MDFSDPTGGVPQSNGSYAYNWSNSSLDSVSSGIPAGNYSVSIEDANGCSYSFNYTLISPSEAFNATVSTLNYAGPSNPPVNVTFIDSTKDISGNSIVVNYYWSWNNVVVKLNHLLIVVFRISHINLLIQK